MYRTLISRINPRFFYPVIVVSLVTAALLFAVKFYPAFASTVGAVAELPAAPNQPAVGSGRIMYSANGSRMYVINADPNNQQPSYIVAGELFQNSSHHPSVSSQTGRIAFAGSRGSEGVGVPLIYAMDSDGLNVHPVTSPVGLPPGVSDTVPAISPDGSQIAFISKRFGSQPNYPGTPQNPDGTPKDSEVFVVNFDGTGLHQVTSSEQTPVNNGTTVATVVAWSGNTLKVSARRGFTNDQGQRVTRTGVFTFNPDGTGESLFLQLGGLDFLDVLDAAGGIILYSFNNAIYVGSGNDLSSYTVITAVKAGGGVRFYQGVRFSPDGSRIVYSGDDDGGSIRTIGIDGSNPVLVRGNLGGTNGGIWWFDAPPIPTPARLRLDPAVVRVVNDGVTMSQVTPSLLDANGNVIFHAADFSTPCGAGYPCTLNPNSFTYFSDGRIRVNNANNTPGYISFCGANGGLSGCSVVSVGTDVDFAEINSSVPSANTNGTGGPGIFTVRRESTQANSALIVNFTLGGAAVRDVDYSLDIVGNTISFSPGQTSFDIRLTPLRAAGNKTVSMNIAAQSGASYLTYAGRDTATINIVDNGPPAAAFSLSSIKPNTGGDGGSVTSTVYGTSIQSGATVRLTRTGQADIVGANTSVASNGLSITTTFNLTGKAQGIWNVLVTNPSNTTAMLAAAFTIERSQGAKVWVDLVGRYTMRSNLTQTFYIVYGNSGDVDSPPTRVSLTVPNDLSITKTSNLADGSSPNLIRTATDTQLEFYVPTVVANSATYLPIQLTAPPQFSHQTIRLSASSFSSQRFASAAQTHPDPSAALTVEVIDATADHLKMILHVSDSAGTGNIESETTVTQVQSPMPPSVQVTDLGDDLQIDYDITVPSSSVPSLNAANSKQESRPDGVGDFFYRLIGRGRAAKDKWDKGKKIKELGTAHKTAITQKELIDCLVSLNKLDALGAANAMGAASSAELFNVLETGAGLVPAEAVPVKIMVGAIKAGLQLTGGAASDTYLNAMSNALCGSSGNFPTDDSFRGACNAIGQYSGNVGNQDSLEKKRVGQQALLMQAAALCLTCSGGTSSSSDKMSVDITAAVDSCPVPQNFTRDIDLLVVNSYDPNEKTGAQGAGPARYINNTEAMTYAVFFENKAEATAPAQTVVITDQLDTSKVDLTTFNLGAFTFGNSVALAPSGLSIYTTDIDLRPAKNLIARVNAQLDKNSGLLTWRFQSIDPATGQPTTDPLAGFLPPNRTSPEGQGSVTFTVMPKAGLATGTEIRNKARIIFDTNAPIDTNEYLNTIDNSLPASHVVPLAGVQSSIVFNVNWTGTDTGSGIQSYDVYASENGGPFTLWQSNATATSGIFIGKPGTGYSFYSVSRDGAGNLEPAKTSGESFTVTPNISNSIDDARYYVWQHYRDFLSRQPDASGLDFWTNQITSCGTAQDCIDIKRINVSAAFYLSIEFQETGYLVERIYKASYGDAMGTSTFGGTHQLAVPIVRRNEFLPDTQQIGQGVVVGQTGWEQTIENNKIAFTTEFVQRSRFTTTFPTTLTPAQFVNMLFANAGVAPSSSDRTAAIGEFGAATNTTDTAARGRALRRVAENSILNQQEFNRAFVLMQYFGYLRRNPNDAPDTDHTGYDFWLTKLNQFNGNFVNAEMVKAFIVSGEYRSRFGR